MVKIIIFKAPKFLENSRKWKSLVKWTSTHCVLKTFFVKLCALTKKTLFLKLTGLRLADGRNSQESTLLCGEYKRQIIVQVIIENILFKIWSILIFSINCTSLKRCRQFVFVCKPNKWLFLVHLETYQALVYFI